MAPPQGTCQESSSVRLKGQRLYGELHRHHPMIRFPGWKSTFGFFCVPALKTGLVRDGLRLDSWFHGLLCRYNAAVKSKREKAIPARGAAIRGDAKEAIHPG